MLRPRLRKAGSGWLSVGSRLSQLLFLSLERALLFMQEAPLSLVFCPAFLFLLVRHRFRSIIFFLCTDSWALKVTTPTGTSATTTERRSVEG